MSAYYDVPDKLKILPTTLAAYSDRSAWIMGEMRVLTYLSFEGENSLKDILGAISRVAKTTRQKKCGMETAEQINERK